jgi:predicted TIM-barrel fold metal-dependent hydrolase
MPIRRFDAHCHLFNGAFVFREVLAISWDAAHRQYPVSVPAEADTVRPAAPLAALTSSDPWQTKLDMLTSLFAVVRETCQENLQREWQAFQRVQGETALLCAAPLMMDIFYIFADPAGDALPTLGHTRADVEDFHERAEILIADLAEKLETKLATMPASLPLLAKAKASMRLLLGECETDLLRALDTHVPDDDTDYAGMAVSWGYRAHLHELLALQAAHPEQLFPFLAVDPRRPGIFDLLKRGKTADGRPLVSKHGPFYGLKVYPPLGFHPAHPLMMEIYEWCVAQDLPVTAHCQPVSFYNGICGTLRDGDGVHYADPRLWEPVLQALPMLRLNLAHLGGEPNLLIQAGLANPDLHHDGTWPARIAALMASYPNVYADLAANTDPRIPAVIADLIAAHPVLAQRVMFGTDFIICMLRDALDGNLEPYFTLFNDQSGDLLYGNAARFMGV